MIREGASADLVREVVVVVRVVLTISPAVRIYVARGATDLRRSIDGLAALVRDPFDLDQLIALIEPPDLTDVDPLCRAQMPASVTISRRTDLP